MDPLHHRSRDFIAMEPASSSSSKATEPVFQIPAPEAHSQEEEYSDALSVDTSSSPSGDDVTEMPTSFPLQQVAPYPPDIFDDPSTPTPSVSPAQEAYIGAYAAASAPAPPSSSHLVQGECPRMDRPGGNR